MEKIILVIGNGFDLNLRLPTSFGDFIRSSYFEELLKSNNALCVYLNKVNEIARWIDVEAELSKYSRLNPSNEKLFEEYKDLKLAFYKYIENDVEQKIINENSNAFFVLVNNYFEKIMKEEQFRLYIFNFNYTNTIERIIKIFIDKKLKPYLNNQYYFYPYEINNIIFRPLIDLKLHPAPPSKKDYIENIKKEKINKFIKFIKIYYPHGSISNKYIILGVEDDANISKEHIFLKKTCDPNFSKFPINIFDDCKKLIVFGHSLGQTDHTYFKNFFMKQCKPDSVSKNIFISHYGESGYYEIMKQLDSLTDNNIGKLRSFNNLKLIDVSDENAWKSFE